MNGRPFAAGEKVAWELRRVSETSHLGVRACFDLWLDMAEDCLDSSGSLDRDRVSRRFAESAADLGDRAAAKLAAAFEIVADTAAGGGWQDVLGEAFGQLGIGGPGQFFTPTSIAHMMGAMHAPDVNAIAAERLRQAAADGQIEPVRVADFSCGSGVMFLGLAAHLPAEIVNSGAVQFHGVDIDVRCVRMARLNLAAHHLGGVVRHGNGLDPASAA